VADKGIASNISIHTINENEFNNLLIGFFDALLKFRVLWFRINILFQQFNKPLM
jgi:hypothetical protein